MLGERIANRRIELGISDLDLAIKCGIIPMTIYEIESGRFNPPWRDIEKIAEALQVDVKFFEGDLPNKIFRINECEWYLAGSLKDAIKAFKKDTPYGPIENPREITKEEYSSLKFVRTYEDELRDRIISGVAEIGFFASTES